jgi:Protein of unknown function (DUF2845)
MRVAHYLFILSLLGAQSASALICPIKYLQIRAGMTSAEVRSACGEPKSIQRQDIAQYQDQRVENWLYSGNQSGTKTARAMRELGYGSSAKPSMSFSFDGNGKIVNFSVDGSSFNTTKVCGTTLSIGDSRNKVMNYCGEPAVKSTGSVPVGQGSVEQQVWTYQLDAYRPVVRVTFEGNKVVSISE